MPTSFTYVCRIKSAAATVKSVQGSPVTCGPKAMASMERLLHYTGRLQYLVHVRVIWGLVKLVNVEVTA